jgi:hypothetical protein
MEKGQERLGGKERSGSSRALMVASESPHRLYAASTGRHSPTRTRRSGWLSPEDYGDRRNTTRELIAGSLIDRGNCSAKLIRGVGS